MGKIYYCFIFILFISAVLVCCSYEDSSVNKIPLIKNWHFKLGDRMEWALPDFNDKHWDTMAVGHLAAGKAFDNYRGYGWYRVKFILPESWGKEKKQSGLDSIKFYFGAIDDCDEIYLNGMLIGTNTKKVYPFQRQDTNFIAAKGLWNVPRKYVLSIKDHRIKWGKENILAIRMFNQYGGGGIYSEVPYIGKYGLEDYLSVDLKSFYKVHMNEFVDREIPFKNNSKNFVIDGNCMIIARNTGTNTIIYQLEQKLKLQPQESKTLFVKFPVSTDPIKFRLEIKDYILHQAIVVKDSIPYVLTP